MELIVLNIIHENFEKLMSLICEQESLQLPEGVNSRLLIKVIVEDVENDD